MRKDLFKLLVAIKHSAPCRDGRKQGRHTHGVISRPGAAVPLPRATLSRGGEKLPSHGKRAYGTSSSARPFEDFLLSLAFAFFRFFFTFLFSERGCRCCCCSSLSFGDPGPRTRAAGRGRKSRHTRARPARRRPLQLLLCRRRSYVDVAGSCGCATARAPCRCRGILYTLLLYIYGHLRSIF